ncbi:MAG: ethanolamine ammonia-lyase subunit EutB, partial [Corynebacterium kroppenstedtii]|nr:ethanolamine ammonia-lyase subunit EutB [Corynebacterium kroppenstedtii]
MFSQHLAGHTYSFASLTEVMAKASPIRSGDQLAGCAANSAAERVAAAMVLADVELNEFIRRPLIEDAVTDLIHRTHDSDAFRPLAHMTVGAFREYLLEQAYRGANISSLAWGLTPEMAAAVSKLMSNGELIAVSAALSVVTKFRTTLGLPGRLSSRLQPNHPTDDPTGVAASVLDGLLFGCGDAVVGINPAGDSPEAVRDLLFLLDEVRRRYSIPMQSSVLTHISTTIDLMEAGAPVDLPFQSIAGTEGALRSFGVSLDMLAEAEQAANELRRGTVGTNALYFETGQGS